MKYLLWSDNKPPLICKALLDLSVMAHCPGRGDEILVGDLAHIIMWEQGGVAQVAGVHSRQVQTNPDGTLDLSDIENKIRSGGDAHLPTTRLICVEQTHNGTGGRVLPLEYLKKVTMVVQLVDNVLSNLHY